MANVLAMSSRKSPAYTRRVLHVGCGFPSAHKLHASFAPDGGWEEIRLDVDPKVRPDIVCSAVDMSSAVADGDFDAVWSSHTIEHLHDHEVLPAFTEFKRVVSPAGFLLLRCPDLHEIAQCLLDHGVEHVAYNSPAGPITPLDMLFGHRVSIAAGNRYMAHHTGFTAERIAGLLLEVGFAEVRTRTETLDLWTIAFAADADIDGDLERLTQFGLDFDAS